MKRGVSRAGRPSELQEQKLTQRCIQHGMAGELGACSMAGHGYGDKPYCNTPSSTAGQHPVTCSNNSPLPASASITGSCVWERSDLNELKALLLPLCTSLQSASCLTQDRTAWTVWTGRSTKGGSTLSSPLVRCMMGHWWAAEVQSRATCTPGAGGHPWLDCIRLLLEAVVACEPPGEARAVLPHEGACQQPVKHLLGGQCMELRRCSSGRSGGALASTWSCNSLCRLKQKTHVVESKGNTRVLRCALRTCCAEASQLMRATGSSQVTWPVLWNRSRTVMATMTALPQPVTVQRMLWLFRDTSGCGSASPCRVNHPGLDSDIVVAAAAQAEGVQGHAATL